MHIDEAKNQLAAGNPRKAAELCRKILEADRSDAKALRLLGLALFQAGDREGALDCFQRLTSLRPLDPSDLANYGFLLLQCGRPKEAAQVLEPLAQQYPSLAQAQLSLGNALLRLGKPEEALARFTLATQADPACFEAWFNLGLLMERQQRITEAKDAYQRCCHIKPGSREARFRLALMQEASGEFAQAAKNYLALADANPQNPALLLRLGNCFCRSGEQGRAVEVYARAAAMAPADPAPRINLGIALKKAKRFDEALAVFHEALRLPGDHAETWYNIGVVQYLLGKLESAIEAFAKAAEADPSPRILYNLGTALKEAGRFQEAAEHLRETVRKEPTNHQALNNLGLCYQELGNLEEAESCFRQALASQPGFAEAHSNLGNLLLDAERFDEAEAAYDLAIRHDPAFSKAWYNKGNCFQQQNRHRQAVAMYRKALEIDPGLVEAHWNLSHSLLLLGEYGEGFQEYLWRWKREKTVKPPLKLPTWKGETAAEATLLVHTEQGLGDSIQFVRYLPLARERVGRIILAAEKALLPLFAGLAGADELLPKGDILAIQERCDLAVGLLDLPSIFTRDAQEIPGQVPYLATDPHLAEALAEAVGEDPGLKVGIVWQGNPKHHNDGNRSCPAELLKPLATVPGCRFFSLQKEHTSPPAWMTDLAPHLETFAHTAAVIHHLDLVISIDTSVAHLAGGLGKPVWTLLPYVPDWRWLLDREDTPWYPTMRLFRQRRRGDWQEVLQRVGKELEGLVKTAGNDRESHQPETRFKVAGNG